MKFGNERTESADFRASGLVTTHQSSFFTLRFRDGGVSAVFDWPSNAVSAGNPK